MKLEVPLPLFFLRHLLERAVVGLLRLAIRLMSRETLAPQVRVRDQIAAKQQVLGFHLWG